MHTLLSNPNIKAQLKQLHSQLLKNPNQYLPQLENILLDKSPSPPPSQPVTQPSSTSQPAHPSVNSNSRNQTTEPKKTSIQQSYENFNKNQQNVYYEEARQPSTQDLLDLRQYYAKDETKRIINPSTITSSSINNPTINYGANSNNNNHSISKNHIAANLTQRSIAREFKHH